MASLDDVARVAARFPEAVEGVRRGTRTWSVAGRTFAWERPFSKADVKRFGTQPVPPPPILAVRVEDLGEKEAVLATHAPHVFTIPHFEGFPAVLVRLATVPDPLLAELVEEGWGALAPRALVEQWLHRDGDG